MKVRDVYRPEVITAEPTEDLVEVASRMRFHEVGALPVFEHGAMHGIITERDVVGAVADGVDPSTTMVLGYMTPNPVTVSPETELSEAAASMLELGARHLPVVELGAVVGMISARDVLIDEAWSKEGVR
jgi:CBS domain-containing protein